MTTSADTALSILAEFVTEVASPEEAAIWLEFGSIIDGDGTLDGLDDQDAKAAIAVTLFDLREVGPDGLRARAEWLESTERGREPLHNPMAVGVAVRRIADLADMTW